jgi:hypothetical protein
MMQINLFDISFLLQGYPVKEAKKVLLTIQNDFATGTSSYQESKKWEIFNYHIANNKAYKNFIKPHKINNREDISVTKGFQNTNNTNKQAQDRSPAPEGELTGFVTFFDLCGIFISITTCLLVFLIIKFPQSLN